MKASAVELLLLKHLPLVLFKKVIVGNPSCTIVHRDVHGDYDKHLKWAVDFDFYLQVLKKTKGHFKYISQPLLNIGFHENQITQVVTRNPEVMIPESHYMLKKYGVGILRNLFVYDYYWRLYRNYSIKTTEEMNKYPFSNDLPKEIVEIIQKENKIGQEKLLNGFVSKFYMFISFLGFI